MIENISSKDDQKRAWNRALKFAIDEAEKVWPVDNLGHQSKKASKYINGLWDRMIPVKPIDPEELKNDIWKL